ncbi:MAG TPA: Uma2 family endonuclease [Urbifossiella sp.]|jgi:Uma2 family endonuclease|nr:Uma2 family endonuclease [Urbifossiella sp.]
MSIADTPAAALPTHLDLPCEDGKPVENFYQPYQTALLTAVLTPWLDRLHRDGQYLVGADNGIYWEITDPPLDGCRAPDWFYIPGVPKLLDGGLRRSYVLWQEKIPPLVVIEYVSGSGAEERDRTPQAGKWWVYEQAIKAGYYVIHDPDRGELEVYALTNGRYQIVPATAAGRFPITPLGIELGHWEGDFQGNPAVWLRAWDRAGGLLPTAEERADAEKTRANALAARLRAHGIDPDAPPA